MADNEEVKDIDSACEENADACENVNQETIDNENAEASEKEEAASSKGKTSRKEKKEKKDKKDQKIEELNDRLMRLMAEYDNYRKRTEKEKSAMYETGVKSFVEKILPVLDNFERGFGCVEDQDDPFTQGMKKIYEQFVSTMNEAGVTVIEAVGQEFDPNLHNAVMHIDDEEYGTNVVVEEFQKGYMYRDSVVRYSMVKVAN